MAWGVFVVAILPVVFRWRAPAAGGPRLGAHLAEDLGYLVSAVICVWMYRSESRRLGRAASFAVVFLVLLFTCIANNVHSFNVDHATNYMPSNGGWQTELQKSVIDLSPLAIPHSYRFLPNSLIQWLQLSGLGYESSRDIYRLVFGLLLFYAIYRYALLFTKPLGGILAMLLALAVYPVSFERYAGQPTDPISHLSFVLAFIFLELDDFPLFLTTILIGSFAKETVLAMAGYYILFCRHDKAYWVRSAILAITGAFAYFGVRLYVLHGHMEYSQVSGVTVSHVMRNWQNEYWRPRFLLTGAAYLPFLLLAWRQTPLPLKRLVFFLLPVLFISSLFFSWLQESRNFMPVVFVLAVITARYLSGGFDQELNLHPAVS